MDALTVFIPIKQKLNKQLIHTKVFRLISVWYVGIWLSI